MRRLETYGLLLAFALICATSFIAGGLACAGERHLTMDNFRMLSFKVPGMRTLQIDGKTKRAYFWVIVSMCDRWPHTTSRGKWNLTWTALVLDDPVAEQAAVDEYVDEMSWRCGLLG